MRPWVPVVAIATLLVLPLAGQAAVGYAYLDGAHWDVPPGGADAAPAAVLIVDSTGDARVQEALLSFRAEWNAMRADPALAALPPVDLSFAGASEACPRPGLQQASGAPARVLVCVDDSLESAAVGGPYLVDRRGHTTLGVVKMRTATLSWTACRLHTAVAHELGHVMGLAHNDAEAFTGGPSLMMSGKGPYRYGCPVWFNAHDRDALAALYRGHAASCTAQRDRTI
jgi:hypothetical protein